MPGEPRRLLLLVHGYSYHPEEMLAYGSLIDPKRRFTVLAPRGPIELPNGAAAWSMPKNRSPEQFPRSVALLDETLNRACARYEVDRSEVIVGGFSQGAIAAIAMALDPAAVRPAAAMCWCGTLPHGRGTPTDFDRLAGMPLLWLRALRDEVIPPDYAGQSRATAAHHGADLTSHDYDSSHALSLEMLADTRTWLAAR